jgi:hypothetical protein
MDLNEQIVNLKKRIFGLRTQSFREPNNMYLYFMIGFLKKQLNLKEEENGTSNLG